ncbi:type II toxin-antitoxin system RelE/ParE family toxin [Parashewanella spongiae]|uniref:Toxin n=1 Tax=Parashewanella spongiae TaxID=342950 RepID=A0A3A6TJ77_9GAMM|nr:type II toxin-antitoxin system RelE/ParE family toxin [Parashewanella spongiae]MCL1080128.1 type II toxin-antitoxin system RelE/ParE family toxin [Parashewanella spongiae]RJY04925.1 type II toxin-antitoxin system RelE/ParE family toxin [Parashewanella spongiae]
MTALNLVLSPIAKVDIQDIYRYGLLNWGSKVATVYIDTLKSHLYSLTEQPFMGVERSILLPNIRSFPSEKHMIFYRVESEKIEIIRILHERQDPQRHIL